eukprot:309485_1
MKNVRMGNESASPKNHETRLKSEILPEYKHDTDNSTDDNLAEMVHDNSEEDNLVPELKEHYNNLSDSYQSPIDEDEEEKMEQEIANRLSHLKINRDVSDNNNIINWNKSYQHKDWDNTKDDNIIDNDNDNDDDDIESIDVGDEHYQSLYDKHTLITHENNNKYKLSFNKEFFSNETFLKYAMLYGTIYVISKYSLSRLYDRKSIDIDSISRKMILISNAIITIFNNHEIWNKPEKAMLSPFKDILNENETNFMDIQKAFYCIMTLLTYFNGKTISKKKTPA